jgi:hypothetical protein
MHSMIVLLLVLPFAVSVTPDGAILEPAYGRSDAGTLAEGGTLLGRRRGGR